ncbi:proton-conducting transporter membrane subunit [Halomonas sp.]|uniref:proton-conducting transporter transmembrane domain-containing protein n=1 Tax=Halomonas sp. TaxID=1486246 RepID=UPI003A0FD34E
MLRCLPAPASCSFTASNLVGLRQRDARRMLGYSSVAQIGLVVAVVSGARLFTDVAPATVALDSRRPPAESFPCQREDSSGWSERWASAPSRRPGVAFTVPTDSACSSALLLVALAGLPPFPGFWAKWQLVVSLTGAGQFLWVTLLLGGSLFEATYLFRFFGILRAPAPAIQGATTPRGDETQPANSEPVGLQPARLAATVPTAVFAAAAAAAGIAGAWLFGFQGSSALPASCRQRRFCWCSTACPDSSRVS